jgi:DNA polymerase
LPQVAARGKPGDGGAPVLSPFSRRAVWFFNFKDHRLMLFLDLETCSDVDLIFHGLMRYAQDPSTKVICMAWAFDDEPVEFWWARSVFSGCTFPQRITDHIRAGGLITAHNAEFERAIFEFVINNDFRLTPAHLNQWRCSMATGLASGYGAALDTLATGLNLPFHKHAEGARLIREYCASGHKDIFDPQFKQDREFMKLYNISDVETMRAAVKCLRPFTDDEWEEYHTNCVVNQRGLPIDVDFCTAALAYTHQVADDANRMISDLTGGLMKKATERKSRDAWLFPKLTPYQMKLLEVYKKGEKKISLDADHRRYLLECDDLDFDARRLLEYIDNAGSSALKKYAVAAHQHVDGRVHNTFLWNGAGRTGRFSGKGLQPHNIRRDVYSDNEAATYIADIRKGIDLEHPAETMARLLRAMIYHPDGLYWVDWSSIEGRVAPWLAVDRDGEDKLDLFRQNRDIYKVTAGDMFFVVETEVNDDQRQAGKIAELSLQFGGSHNALIGMGKNFGVSFEEQEARNIVINWRSVNPWAERIWKAYDTAIVSACRSAGVPFDVGRVTFQSDGKNFLWCRLPSGRLLSYPKPRFESYMTPWDEERFGLTFQTHFKPAANEPPIRRHARGALVFQNTVQAVAADLLREALLYAADARLNIVGHVHDEIIGIGTPDDGAVLDEIMLASPIWAPGLPIATGGVSHGTRYGK